MSTSWSIARHWLRGHWRLAMGWCLGVAIPPLLYLSLFQSMKDTGLMQDKINTLPAEFRDIFKMDDISTPAGYAQTTVFGLMGMVLCLIAAVSMGSSAIAGDEEAGTLELTLSHRVSRTQAYVGKLLAVVIVWTLMAATLTGCTVAMSSIHHLDLPLGHIVAAGVAEWLLMLCFGLLAAGVGAATGRRAVALTLATVIAAAAYFAHTMGEKLWSGLPAWSPMHWAFGAEPLKVGFSAGMWWLPVVFTVAAVVGGWRFARRDLGV